MIDIKKHPLLTRCADIAAVLALMYPPLTLLWTQYRNEPGPAVIDVEFILSTAGMLLSLPGLLWLILRYRAAPPGTYPFIDNIVKNPRRQYLAWFCFAVLFILLTRVVDIIKIER